MRSGSRQLMLIILKRAASLRRHRDIAHRFAFLSVSRGLSTGQIRGLHRECRMRPRGRT